MTPEERELARKNNVWGWSLLALAIVLALGTVAVGADLQRRIELLARYRFPTGPIGRDGCQGI